jgi:hypothetical protein
VTGRTLPEKTGGQPMNSAFLFYTCFPAGVINSEFFTQFFGIFALPELKNKPFRPRD